MRFSFFLATQMTDSIKKDFRNMFFYRNSLFSYAFLRFSAFSTIIGVLESALLPISVLPKTKLFAFVMFL